jgi:hypothetical protein
MVLREHEASELMLEVVTPADTLPLDDIECSALVLDVTGKTRLATEGGVQATRVLHGGVTAEALLIRHTLARLVTLLAAFGMVVGGVPLVEWPG